MHGVCPGKNAGLESSKQVAIIGGVVPGFPGILAGAVVLAGVTGVKRLQQRFL